MVYRGIILGLRRVYQGFMGDFSEGLSCHPVLCLRVHMCFFIYRLGGAVSLGPSHTCSSFKIYLHHLPSVSKHWVSPPILTTLS